jgi:sugar phosphate isomerase/epimerase
MTIKIASCGWGAPFEAFCATAAQAGYEGIETNLEEWVGREGELRSLLERYGLSIAACSAGGSFLDPTTRAQEIAQVEETARRMSEFGIHTLEMHCGRRPVGGPSDEQIRRYADGLNETGRRCNALGVSLGIHNHCISFLETEEEIDRLYQFLDPGAVGLGFDTGHLALAGCNPAAVFRRQIGRGFRVAYIHLKDLYQVSMPAGESERMMGFDELLSLAVAADVLTWLAIRDIDGRRIVLGGGKLGHDFLRDHRGLIRGVRCCDIREHQFAELGQGSVDFQALFAVLNEAGYDGWASVELDVAYRPRQESAKISRDFLGQAIGV